MTSDVTRMSRECRSQSLDFGDASSNHLRGIEVAHFVTICRASYPANAQPTLLVGSSVKMAYIYTNSDNNKIAIYYTKQRGMCDVITMILSGYVWRAHSTGTEDHFRVISNSLYATATTTEADCHTFATDNSLLRKMT